MCPPPPPFWCGHTRFDKDESLKRKEKKRFCRSLKKQGNKRRALCVDERCVTLKELYPKRANINTHIMMTTRATIIAPARRGTLAPSVNATAKRRITATAASTLEKRPGHQNVSSSTFKRVSSFFADQKVALIGKGRDAALTTTRSRKLVTVHASDAKTPPETFAAAVATSEK